MWVVFGIKDKIIYLFELDIQECPYCGNMDNTLLSVRFSYAYVWVLPLFLTARQYFITCSVCKQHIITLNNKIIDKKLKSPIPWIYKFGWVIPVGLIFSCLIPTVLDSIGML